LIWQYLVHTLKSECWNWNAQKCSKNSGGFSISTYHHDIDVLSFSKSFWSIEKNIWGFKVTTQSPSPSQKIHQKLHTQSFLDWIALTNSAKKNYLGPFCCLQTISKVNILNFGYKCTCIVSNFSNLESNSWMKVSFC